MGQENAQVIFSTALSGMGFSTISEAFSVFRSFWKTAARRPDGFLVPLSGSAARRSGRAANRGQALALVQARKGASEGAPAPLSGQSGWHERAFWSVFLNTRLSRGQGFPFLRDFPQSFTFEHLKTHKASPKSE